MSTHKTHVIRPISALVLLAIVLGAVGGLLPAAPATAATPPPYFSYAADPRRCDYYEHTGWVRPDQSYARATWGMDPTRVDQWYSHAPCLFGEGYSHPTQAHEWNVTPTPGVLREGDTFTLRADIHWTDFPHQGGADHDVVIGEQGGAFWKATSATAWALNPDCCIYDEPPLRLVAQQGAPDPISWPSFSSIGGCGLNDTFCTWRMDRAPVFPSGTRVLPWFAVGVATGRPVYPRAIGTHYSMWEAPLMLVPDPTPMVDIRYEPVNDRPRAIQFHQGSFDRNGYIVSGRWNFGDGGTSTDPHPIHEFTTPGDSFPVRLTVTDNEGYTKSITKRIDVSHDPVADFRFFADPGHQPPLLSLDGSFSKVVDPGVTIVEYRWTITGIDCTGACFTQNATGPFPAVELPNKGQYRVALVVVDSRGRESRPFEREVAVTAPSLRVTVTLDPDRVKAPEPTAEDPDPEPVPVTATVRIENIGELKVEHINPPETLTIFTRDGTSGTIDRRLIDLPSPGRMYDYSLDPGWFTNTIYNLGVVDDGWWRVMANVLYEDPNTGRTASASDEAPLDATGNPLRFEIEAANKPVVAGTIAYVVGELENTSTNQRIALPKNWLTMQRGDGAHVAGRRPAVIPIDETLGHLMERCGACGKRVPRTLAAGEKVRFAIGYATFDETPFRSRADLVYTVKATAKDPAGVETQLEAGPTLVRIPLQYLPPRFDIMRFSTRFRDRALIQMGDSLIEGANFFTEGHFKQVPAMAVYAMYDAWTRMSLAERMQFLQMPANYIGVQVTQALYNKANAAIGELMTLNATGQYDALADRLGTITGVVGAELTTAVVTEALTAGFGYLFAAGGKLTLAGVRRTIPHVEEALSTWVRRAPKAAEGVEVDLKAIKNDVPVSLGQGEKFWGVAFDKLDALIEYCKANKVIVVLRDRSEEAMRWLREFNAIGKMEDIKTKAVNWIDAEWLGFATDDVGSVVFRRPRDPRRLATWNTLTAAERSDVLARFELREAKYHAELFDMTDPNGLKARGVRYREGGVEKAGTYRIDDAGRVYVDGRRVAGDIDVLHILREDGREFLASEYAELMGHFRWLEQHLDLQHMSTGNWWAVTAKHQAIRLETFTNHNAVNGKALLSVSGTGMRTARVDMFATVFAQGLPKRVVYAGGYTPIIGNP